MFFFGGFEELKTNIMNENENETVFMRNKHGRNYKIVL